MCSRFMPMCALSVTARLSEADSRLVAFSRPLCVGAAHYPWRCE